MLKLKVGVMTICGALLLNGCAKPTLIDPARGPYFCDVEQPRRPTSVGVLDYRVLNDRGELVKDQQTNKTGLEYCEWKP